MNVPHSGGHWARSQARCKGLASAVEEKITSRKRAGCEFPRGTCECAAEVIVWVGVLSGKPWTAVTQDGCDLWGGRATLEQFFGDPFISDAPVGLWEAFQNPQPLQPTGIDFRAISDCGRAEPTSLCQPHLGARAPTQECVEDASGSSGSPNRAWPPPAKQRLGKPGRLGRAAPSPREGSRASCAAVVSDW